MTATEFRQLPETNRLMELIHGELIVSPSPMSSHRRLVQRIFGLIQAHMPDGEAMLAPMDVYLDDDNAVQPDVFWVAADSRCVERGGYFYGAPELVVEVVSPASSTRDRRDKFDLYEAHGAREYWLADPAAQHLEVWQRQGERFARLGIFTEGDSFRSVALGRTVTLTGVFPAASP
ncbi:MAG: Uma2 family endonuclease [Aggregatilineales bacterium]